MDPIKEGHVLLVPKVHYLDIEETPDGYSMMQEGFLKGTLLLY